jgi:plastocyanin
MRRMKGARALASGMLVLALSCAIPAISTAQDAGTTTDATTTAMTTPDPDTLPADQGGGSQSQPGSQSNGGGDSAGNDQGGSAPAPHPSPAQPQPAAAPSDGPATGASAKAHKSASASVTMGDLFFSPASVTIAAGDTVTWRNTGQAPHNATADDGSFKTPTLDNGQSASHTFTQAGTFSYICTIHPNMHGTVRVLASSSGGGGGGGNGGGASSSSSSGSSSSEASAVASPNAAGNGNTLPMTGMAVGGLALVGLGLVALGLLARQADRERSRLRWFSIF